MNITELSEHEINQLTPIAQWYKNKNKYYVYNTIFYLLKDGRVVAESESSRMVKDFDSYYFDTKEDALEAIKNLKQNYERLTQENLKMYYKESSQKQAYRALHEACTIEVGDTVQFVRYWDYGELGCGVGPFVKTNIVPGAKGIVVEKSDIAYRVDGDLKNCLFPCFALKLIEKKVESIKINLNESYTAEVFKDKVTVGCQTFPFDCIDKLYQASLKIQGKI